jgi:hypothetical protein
MIYYHNLRKGEIFVRLILEFSFVTIVILCFLNSSLLAVTFFSGYPHRTLRGNYFVALNIFLNIDVEIASETSEIQITPTGCNHRRPS